MSYPLSTYALISYIESHLKDGKIPYNKLEQCLGFSYAHIRDFFQKDTGSSLARYIRTRKICASAFELLHSDKTILELALDYGFSSHESYTRAFTRITGRTPSDFRKERPLMGKSELLPGIYGVGLLCQKEQRSDINMNRKEKYQNNSSTILYGVPKVEWGTYGGGTPYPICLKACADYLGDDLDYAEILTLCGGAFRFTWNETEWDMCNVDIYHTFTEGGGETVYSYAAKALGREFTMLDRTEQTTKEDFIHFIKKHIDEGYPCIAQGIIGPPEACIITGYRDNGNTLLGWNFFQQDPAFGGSVQFDDCGYFICDNWWENTDTQSVMCLGPVAGPAHTPKEVIKTAVSVMTGRKDGSYCKGISGYAAWAKMLSDESSFSAKGNEVLLFEKMFCQDDAMNCLRDGRNSAAKYFTALAKSEKDYNRSNTTQVEQYKALANLFSRTKNLVEQMTALFNSPASTGEDRTKRLANREVREQTCGYIRQIEETEKRCLGILQTLIKE